MRIKTNSRRLACAVLLSAYLLVTFFGSSLKGETSSEVAWATIEAALNRHSDLGLSGYRFRTVELVRVVNHLRSLGKTRAIEILKAVSGVNRGVQRLDRPYVFLICRCLFENPEGWEPPKIGATEASEAAIKECSSFPLVMSDGVPFLPITGYTGSGFPETPDRCVRQCESLPMNQADLPLQNHEAAARSLIASPLFAKLYPDPGLRDYVARIVLQQASDEKK